MTETQDSIVAWADATFGKCDVQAAWLRMREELNELYDAISGYASFSKAQSECADVLITLYRVAACVGCDLNAEVDRKMNINRGRRWQVNPDGTGQHIP